MLLLSLQYYEYYIIDTYRVRGRVPPIHHYVHVRYAYRHGR